MPAQTHSDFEEQRKRVQHRINHILDRRLASVKFPQLPLAQAMRYGTLQGGKRLRPFLTYAVGNLFGVSDENLDVPAAAIECIHAYSLLHDDLPAMDNDDLRRGQPTCHIVFGEANAILAGDALQTLAFDILASTPMPDVQPVDRIAMIAELARSSGTDGMCCGQSLDLAAENTPVSLAELEQIHHHKTGALIRAAIRLGAFAAGEKARPMLDPLDDYGNAIGLAFQIQDDILDIVGDTAVIGKQQGHDIEQRKSTYPALLGLDQAQEKTIALYHKAVQALEILNHAGYNTKLLNALANFIIQRDK